MLLTAEFSEFTSVPSGKWEFSHGLNVIVGENGLGKSHVLKAIYSTLKALDAAQQPVSGQVQLSLSKSYLEKQIAEELTENLRPDSLGRLVKRRPGRNRTEVKLRFKNRRSNIDFGFATNSKSQVDLMAVPQKALEKSPVFIPTRELVTLCPWFVALYDNYHVPFEKSWRDTVSLLGAPNVRGPRESKVRDILEPLEEAMGGKVEVDVNGRFFLRTADGRMEAPLVAEGLRKFAMLARLVSTGVLLEQGYLFWDEPETNLNPKLLKVLARVITTLSTQGIQIFIATHSLFLLREISMCTDGEGAVHQSRYFSIVASNGDEVSYLEQGDRIEDIDALVLLDEELMQSDRYMDIISDEGTD